MGGIYLYENEFEKALSVYSDSMKIASELKDELLRVPILHQMGNVHFKTLDFPKALETYSESLNIKGNFESGDYLEQLYNVSKGVTNGQIGRAIMKSHYQASALQAVWKQQLIEALSYIWTAFNLFKNHNVFYYKMTQKDLQYVKEQLGDSEYENSLNKIKNIP